MARTVAIGIQDFETLITRNCFYVDKTKFIREWWESEDGVTLITRPRRFGKTLTMNMLERFFSVKFAGQGEVFEGLEIWKDEKYRSLQGTYPVIGLTFATVKEQDPENAKRKINAILEQAYRQNLFLMDSGTLNAYEREYFDRVCRRMEDADAAFALHRLSEFLSRYYGKKVLIFLDEYDTPMLEAYVGGYWNDMVSYLRNLFNAAFKTNPYLERAVMTGITRISKESFFSDLNHLEVITCTLDKYADIFGFTEEVFAAMDEQGLEEKEEVQKWYDGFTFDKTRDIYNPWSIINYLDKGKFKPYWVNTSSNSLAGLLVQQADAEARKQFETLLQGGTIEAEIDEEIVFSQLDKNSDAAWSLLLASGYFKALDVVFPINGEGQSRYTLSLTNMEVRMMFGKLVREWFAGVNADCHTFLKALLVSCKIQSRERVRAI